MNLQPPLNRDEQLIVMSQENERLVDENRRLSQSAQRQMSEAELALAKSIGEQMNGTIPCPRKCVDGQALSTFGDFEDQLFCPHCEMEVNIVVKYL